MLDSVLNTLFILTHLITPTKWSPQGTKDEVTGLMEEPVFKPGSLTPQHDLPEFLKLIQESQERKPSAGKEQKFALGKS